MLRKKNFMHISGSQRWYLIGKKHHCKLRTEFPLRGKSNLFSVWVPCHPGQVCSLHSLVCTCVCVCVYVVNGQLRSPEWCGHHEGSISQEMKGGQSFICFVHHLDNLKIVYCVWWRLKCIWSKQHENHFYGVVLRFIISVKLILFFFYKFGFPTVIASPDIYCFLLPVVFCSVEGQPKSECDTF